MPNLYTVYILDKNRIFLFGFLYNKHWNYWYFDFLQVSYFVDCSVSVQCFGCISTIQLGHTLMIRNRKEILQRHRKFEIQGKPRLMCWLNFIGRYFIKLADSSEGYQCCQRYTNHTVAKSEAIHSLFLIKIFSLSSLLYFKAKHFFV